MIGIKTAWQQVKEEIRSKARAEVYAELKAKTLSEIAAELGIDESHGSNGNGNNTPSPDRKSDRPENAC